MNAVSTNAHDHSSPARSRSFTAGLSDWLGERHLIFDAAAGGSLEVLRFQPAIGDAPGFETALRKRVELLQSVQHPSLSTIQAVERSLDGQLSLISRHTAGRRLSELAAKAHGAPFALELIRLVTPALVALQRAGDDMAHGILSPDRIVVTRDGRLVVVEHALASAVQALGLTRDEAHGHGLITLSDASPVRFNDRTDVAQLAFMALSLLVGRQLNAADYPNGVRPLLEEFVQGADSPIVSGKIRGWLERAMQMSPRSFQSSRDAQDAFPSLPTEADMRISAVASGGLLEFKSEGPRAVVSMPHVKQTPVSPAPKPEPVEAEAEAMVEPIEAASGSGSRRGLFLAIPLILAGAAAAYFVWLRPQEVTAPPAAPPAQIQTAAVQPDPTSPAPVNPAGDVTTPPPAAIGAAPAAAGVALTTPSPTPAASPAATPATAPAATLAGAGTAAVPAGTATAGAPTQTTAGQRFGGLTVKAAIDLQILREGTPVGSTASPLALAEGPHRLEFVNESVGFRYSQTVTIRNGQMTSVTIALPTGKLSINAVPWAEVLIDGTPHGETPLANLTLPIGPHELVFRHPQLGEHKKTVIVRADVPVRVTQAMQQNDR